MPKKATGNAMSDANSGASDLQAILAGIEAGLGQSAQSGGMLAQEAQAFGPNLDTANAQLDAVAADCMWPPSAQVTIPIIPGVYSQSFQIPCLLTYSEARAVFAVGLIIAGAQLILTGVGILVAAEVAPAVLTVAGIRSLGRRGGGGSRGGGAAPAAPAEETAETTTKADVTAAA